MFNNVILKDQNESLILYENLSFFGMLERHISSIQQCQCGSNICNIKGDRVQNVGATMLEYFPCIYLENLFELYMLLNEIHS